MQQVKTRAPDAGGLVSHGYWSGWEPALCQPGVKGTGTCEDLLQEQRWAQDGPPCEGPDRYKILALQLPEPFGCLAERMEPAPFSKQSSRAIKISSFAFPSLWFGGVEHRGAADILILKHLTLTLKCKQSLLGVITLFHSANTVYYS